MTPRRCRTCGESKAAEDFTTNGHPADRVTQAYRPDCKTCRAAARRARYASRTPDEIARDKALKQAAYERTRETYRCSERARRESDPERARIQRREAGRRFRAAHPERVREKTRREQFARRVGKRPEDIEYGELLLRDPCSYCGEPATTIDHIEPLALGGENRWENLTAACGSCNSRKRHTPLLAFLAAWSAERPTEIAD